MKSTCIFLLCFYTVSIAQDPDGNTAINKNQDDSRWIWGVVEETTSKTENRNNNKELNTTTTTELTPNNACSFPKPPTPDFSAPGKKTSQEKCEEYVWDKKVTAEISRKVNNCTRELNKGIYAPAAVGGRPTLLGEYPHMGAIGWVKVTGGYDFKCGSTLISSKFVLTAAHCSRASSADTSLADVLPKVIRLNDKNLYQKDANGFFVTEDVNISRIIVHPEYQAPKKYFDIALMEMQYDVTFTYRIQPACLWTKDDITELGREATLTGWGVLRAGSPNISPELQAGVVDIINNTYCDQLLQRAHNRNWQGMEEHQLCAGKLAGGVDACQGDSGGPLQVKQIIDGQTIYQVIGVTSFGIGCAAPNTPGIYTRVSSFVDWIDGYV